MTVDTFFEKFDQFADAPDAVAKMRELVLELAVRGKLSKQNSTEKPPVIRDKNFSNHPYRIPENWAWTTLDSIAELITSGSRGWAKYYSPSGPVFITMGNLSRGSYALRLGKITHVRPPSSGEGTRTRLQADDIVISITGDVGNLGLVPNGFGEAYINQHCCLLRLQPDYRNRYVAEFLRSTCAQQQFRAPQRGIKNSFRLTDTDKLWIPVPPFAEQKRIVAKVDELMALCDRLEAQQQERDEQASALARASLARFAEAPTPDNLNLLFHKSYSISPADLRMSILTLAVRGKLSAAVSSDAKVPQLKEFREAAAALANELGLRSPKELIEEAEPPFDIPRHWRWMPLAETGIAQTGTTPSKSDPKAFDGDVPFIKPADIFPNAINYANESLTRYGAESGSRLAPAGSLLMVCIGTIGKCNLIERECAFNQQINSILPVQFIESRYLLVAARTPYFHEAAWSKSSATTIAILNKGKWLSIPIPIPPLAEQRRIVAKVDQLMALVDQLETQLAASRATAKNLLESLVVELTQR